MLILVTPTSKQRYNAILTFSCSSIDQQLRVVIKNICTAQILRPLSFHIFSRHRPTPPPGHQNYNPPGQDNLFRCIRGVEKAISSILRLSGSPRGEEWDADASQFCTVRCFIPDRWYVDVNVKFSCSLKPKIHC